MAKMKDQDRLDLITELQHAFAFLMAGCEQTEIAFKANIQAALNKAMP